MAVLQRQLLIHIVGLSTLQRAQKESSAVIKHPHPPNTHTHSHTSKRIVSNKEQIVFFLFFFYRFSLWPNGEVEISQDFLLDPCARFVQEPTFALHRRSLITSLLNNINIRWGGGGGWKGTRLFRCISMPPPSQEEIHDVAEPFDQHRPHQLRFSKISQS